MSPYYREGITPRCNLQNGRTAETMPYLKNTIEKQQNISGNFAWLSDAEGVKSTDANFHRPSAGLLLGLAGMNSLDGALAAMKNGIPYDTIRSILSKNIRHFFETPLDELIKELEP